MKKTSTCFYCTKLQCGFAGVMTDIMCDYRGTMLNFLVERCKILHL